MPRERIKKVVEPKKKTSYKLTKKTGKDPEAPYSGNPTPGKPGWNISSKSGDSIWKQGKGGA